MYPKTSYSVHSVGMITIKTKTKNKEQNITFFVIPDVTGMFELL